MFSFDVEAISAFSELWLNHLLMLNKIVSALTSRYALVAEVGTGRIGAYDQQKSLWGE